MRIIEELTTHASDSRNRHHWRHSTANEQYFDRLDAVRIRYLHDPINSMQLEQIRRICLAPRQCSYSPSKLPIKQRITSRRTDNGDDCSFDRILHVCVKFGFGCHLRDPLSAFCKYWLYGLWRLRLIRWMRRLRPFVDTFLLLILTTDHWPENGMMVAKRATRNM